MRNRALTIAELIIILIIIGIVVSVGVAGWQSRIELERQSNVRAMLKMVWQAQETYFAWKNCYTFDWDALAIENPNTVDRFYVYLIEEATASDLAISATRKGTAKGLRIDETGQISEF